MDILRNLDDIKRLIPNSQNTVAITLIGFIGVVGGLSQLLVSVIPNPVVYLVTLTFIIISFRELFRREDIRTSRGLPEKEVTYHPFSVTVETAWKRNKEAAELATLIKEACHTHIVISGPSGAGKTTLVSMLLPPFLKTVEIESIFLVHHDASPIEVMEIFDKNEISRTLFRDQYTHFMQEHSCFINEIFDPTFEQDRRFQLAKELWQKLANHLESILPRDRTIVFMFDQIDDALHLLRVNLKQENTSPNAFETYFFIRLIQFLRRAPGVRTLFAIRAEYLYYSYDFLESKISECSEGDTGTVLKHFLCPGINTISDKESADQVITSFRGVPQVKQYAGQFSNINGLNNRAFSNTFLVQLCGFIVEHFYENDEGSTIREFLVKEKDRILCITYYFNYLFNQYSKENSSADDLELLKIIVFTIAVENRIAGRAITQGRLSALAHIPSKDVKPAVTFLTNRGLVRKDFNSAEYRLVHDIISDYAIGNERFEISTRLKEAIQGLCEARVRTEDLKLIKEFPNPLFDLTCDRNIGLYFIWGFYVYGALLICFPKVCEFLYPLFQHVWLSRSCPFASQFYVIIFLMQVVWVTFIYFVDRGFLRHTLKPSCWRRLSQMTPVVGVLLGVLVSQSPALFLIPVVIGGLLMGGLLYVGAKNGSFVGRSASENRRVGIRSCFNMLFPAAATIITALVLWDDLIAHAFWKRVGELFGGSRFKLTENGIIVGWMYLANAAMIYFWWHVRREQQSQIALAARLAEYDRSGHQAYDENTDSS